MPLNPDAVLDPDKRYIALIHSHYYIGDDRHDQAIWTRPMLAGRCSSIGRQRTTARDILLFIAGFDEDLSSKRIDRLELYEMPTIPVYTTPTRDKDGNLLIHPA